MSIPSQILPKEPAKNIPVPNERTASIDANSKSNQKPTGQNPEIPKGYREKLEKSLKDLDQSEETQQSQVNVSNESETSPEQTQVELSDSELKLADTLPDISFDAEAVEVQTIGVESVSVDHASDSQNDSSNTNTTNSEANQTKQTPLEEPPLETNSKKVENANQPPNSLQTAFEQKTQHEKPQSKQATEEIKQTENQKTETPKPPASFTKALQNSNDSENNPNQNIQDTPNRIEVELKNENQLTQIEENEPAKAQANLTNEETTKIESTEAAEIKLKPDDNTHQKEISNPTKQNLNVNASNNFDNSKHDRNTQPSNKANSKTEIESVSAPSNIQYNKTPTSESNIQSQPVKSSEESNQEKPAQFDKQIVHEQKSQQPTKAQPNLEVGKPEINIEAKQDIEVTQTKSKSESTIAPAEPRNVETVFSKQNTEAKVTAERIVDQVAQSVQKAADAGKVFKVRLDPPELGVLQIELTKVNGTIVARIETETASTQRLVLENIAQLKETLAQQGNPIDKIDVEWNQRGFEEESSNRQFNQTNSDKNQSDKNTNAQKVSSNSETQTDQEADEADNKKEKSTLTRHDEIMTGLDIKV